VLSLVDQEDGELFCADVYGGRVGILPYIMPGFRLANRASDIYELKPKVEGLILQKHGIMTFGSTAREAYERMIELTTLAESGCSATARPCSAPGLSRNRWRRSPRWRRSCAAP